MKPLLAWALQHVVYLQRSRLSPNQQSFTGGSMCLESLCLFAPFPKHLYVFVVLMNGTKVSGGPVQRGVCGREQPNWGWRRGPLSGQLPWVWQWEQKTARMMETCPRNLLPLFPLPKTPTPRELLSVDDRWPSLSFTIKPLVPIADLRSPMPVVHTCAQTRTHASLTFLSSQLGSPSLILCPVLCRWADSWSAPSTYVSLNSGFWVKSFHIENIYIQTQYLKERPLLRKKDSPDAESK